VATICRRGVIKMVKVYVAVKRKLSVGRQEWRAATATRAWSRASCPREDMPYLPDGNARWRSC